MSSYDFDCETDGLLEELTVAHSLVLGDIKTGETHSFCDQPNYPKIDEGLRELMDADLICGHNVIKFDIPALQKVYPWFKPRGVVRDTLVLSRLIKADIKDDDFQFAKKMERRGTPHLFPKHMIGKHSLESWGYRLGVWKGDYSDARKKEAKALGIKDKAEITRFIWGAWNKDMQDYCEQDVAVSRKLREFLEAKLADGWGEHCVELEHEVAWLIARQERYGVGFDEQAAAAFYAKLVGHQQRLYDELQKSFPPKTVETVFVPKVNNKKMGYVKGEPFIKRQVVPFNPGSRQQLAERLQQLGWKPQAFGKDGVPTIDDEVLSELKFKEAEPLKDYFVIEKRLGALANGKQAWLKNVRNGRIHPEVITNGAVTGRMTHRIVVNVPGAIDKKTGEKQLYGIECRALFVPKKGNVQVGCDADSLEGRVMGHYMGFYDGGAYATSLLYGNKAEGTDNHSRTAKALAKWNCHRETAKTYFYALVYGAFDAKLGEILGATGSKKAKEAVGKESREAVMKGIPGLDKLVNALSMKAKKYGFITGLDGRRLRVRSAHAILNTLFQSAGAVVMKEAAIILDTELCGVKPSVIGRLGVEAATKLVPGTDYEFMLNYHDEWQLDVKPPHVQAVSTAATEAIRLAGEYYKFRCPLKGNADIGDSWAATH
ncbi:DNA polymerase [Bradyrhizobium sp. 83012]|uniref:DNA polymerase n=1 Tax=Bradyrhizobium aeschynomenes TaxID=2734909 RepID=A0ABX2CB71_9BRAD|nr:DNA polymerase [Bradyrhizobium aeschynomenes]NPU64612.1 DNA polymerase [Bradyrhizobium aeschynomenes]